MGRHEDVDSLVFNLRSRCMRIWTSVLKIEPKTMRIVGNKNLHTQLTASVLPLSFVFIITRGVVLASSDCPAIK